MQFPQPHCRSYYAATANADIRYEKLAGAQAADVCIVGGGFTGVATALNLAERGYNVILLEANRVAWGASGRNGGQLIGGISGEQQIIKQHGAQIADLVWEMRWAGHEIIRERVDKYGIDCDLKYGYIDVALKPRHMDSFRADHDELVRRNFPHETRLVSAAEIQEILATKTYLGGHINMGNGHLHPLNLCSGEAQAAVSLGGKIFEHSPVVRIEHGSRAQVHTMDGYVEADFVVLAGNTYHSLERRYLSGFVFPAGSFIIATETLTDAMVREINPLDLAVCDPNYVLDYFRLSADKRLLFGGRCNYSGREPKSIQKTLLPRLLRIYPQLQGVKIEYEWGGKIGVVINRVPHLGRIGSNVFFAQGYSGHGVNVTHLVGGIMADVIAGTSERFDVFAKIKHYRIPGGQWIGNQLISLGMIYFRLLDLL